ncbi:MAG: DUF5719 family protein [Acidimicrobiales bacterium]
MPTSDAGRRALSVLLVLLVIGAGVAVDRVVGRTPPEVAMAAPASALVAGDTATSSGWYCAGAAGAPAGSHTSVVLTNQRAQPVGGTVDVFTPASGAGGASAGVPSATELVTVPADGQLAVPLPGPAAARVVLSAGSVGALEVVSGPNGWSATPCASAASGQWYFAHGSTASGHGLHLAVFNPSSSDAVVDVSFVSASAGLLEPPAYQGLPVPAGSVVVENLPDHVPNDASLATSVTALSGSVVAAEVEETTTSANGGMSVVPGVSRAGRIWAFAQSTTVPGGGNTFTVFNPTTRRERVTVSLALTAGQTAPITMSVNALSTATIAAQSQTRIPPGAVFGAVFDAGHGGGIVVSRETTIPPADAAPTVGVTVGAPGPSTRWLVPPVPPPGSTTWALAIVDTAGRPVRVTVATRDLTGASTPLPHFDHVRLTPGTLLDIGPTPAPPIGTVPLEISADGPVAVELDPEPVGGPGTVAVMGWPFADGA